MLNKSYNVINNQDEILIAVNVINKKKDDKILFIRNDNNLIININNKDIICYSDIPYQVWKKINNKKCFLVEFGSLGAIEEYDIILS